MKVRLLLCILFLFFLTTCATLESPSEISPDQKRYLRLQTLINRIGAPGFHPEKGERLYPFTYTFRKAEGGEIVRQGEGFVLVNDPLWCLVRRWRDSITGNPGQRMLIIDRNGKKFEAEFRQWPEGHLRQRWNHWTCMRFTDPNDEGPERVIHQGENYVLYEAFSWYENGLLARITRFSNSFVRYSYEGLKVKRIEFGSNGTVTTFAEFTYD